MGHRANAIPPVKCIAHSQVTGKRCGQWAIPGTTVCRWHGGRAGQTQRAAYLRTTLAELLAADPRDPRVALLDAVHAADAIFREDRVRIEAGDTLTAEELDRFTQNLTRLAALAKTAIDGRFVDQITRDLEQQGVLLGGILSKALDQALGLLDLDPARLQTVRDFALQTAQSELLQLEGKPAETPTAPDLGLTWATLDPEGPAAGPESTAAGSAGPSAGEDMPGDVVDAEIVDDDEPEEAVLAEIVVLRRELAELGVDPDTVKVD